MGLFDRHTTTVADAAARVDGGAVLVDVRTKQEWRQGYALGARHISLESLPKRCSKLEGKEVYVICRSGNRSRQAARYLRDQGIDATNVRGGMIAWKRNGLTIVGAR